MHCSRFVASLNNRPMQSFWAETSTSLSLKLKLESSFIFGKPIVQDDDGARRVLRLPVGLHRLQNNLR